MSVVLERGKGDSIHIDDMKDGDIAEIVTRMPSGEHVGKIVQRIYQNLIIIGESGMNGWTGFFVTRTPKNRFVRILKDGEKLVIKTKE